MRKKGSKKQVNDKAEGTTIDNITTKLRNRLDTLLQDEGFSQYLLDGEKFYPTTRHEMWLLTTSITNILILEEFKRCVDELGKIRLELMKRK